MLWDDSLTIGIPVVDAQHQEMFRQVDYLLNSKNKQKVQEVLDFLDDYVIKHFGTEELMQKSSKYPHSEEHKRSHEDFVVTMKELKNEYKESGEELLVLMKLTQAVLNWLRQHIMVEDKDFAKYFRESKLTDIKLKDA